ncbi:MAG: cupredoxin domain-containing protein [Dehalococcoidia bacterium]
MIRSTAAAFAVAMLAGLFGAGCGDVDVPGHPDPLEHQSRDETQELRLQTNDVRFVPVDLTATTGVTTELTLENFDDVEHDFQIDEIDAEIIEGGSGSGEHREEHTGAALTVHTEAGETASVTFVANERGTYEFYCTIPGHKDSGMVGTLTVE